jgi:serine phosphatase RsbU (regulator of sigma subunit)
MALAAEERVLWVGATPIPAKLQRAAERRWRLQPCKADEPLGPQLDAAGLAVVSLNGSGGDLHELTGLLDALEPSAAVAILLLPGHAEAAWREAARRRGHFLCLPEEASAEQLAARLEAAAALQPSIRALREELAAERSARQGAGRKLVELDEEMRLAESLQRDFLPRSLPEVGGARFAVLYRPASWVSGDIYDVVRLDETHVGFYVADAVGHGLPAALLTMFIKKALQTKRIYGNTYEIIAPDVSMQELNASICEQSLSSCQFCTAVYCVLDAAELMLTFARAGHPQPILLRGGGRAELIDAPGVLLGVFPEAHFEPRAVRLEEGDRLILYTDGAESWPRDDRPRERLKQAAASLSHLPREEMLPKLAERIEAARPPGREEDDITIVAMDIERQAAGGAG